MRTVTVEKQLYTFAELSDDAKQNVKQLLNNFEFGADSHRVRIAGTGVRSVLFTIEG